jgi:hypothetical protein
MFTITWLTATNEVDSISTPKIGTAYAIFASLCILRYRARLWHSTNSKQSLLF